MRAIGVTILAAEVAANVAVASIESKAGGVECAFSSISTTEWATAHGRRRPSNRAKRTASIEQLLGCEKPKRGSAARPVIVAGDMNADRWGRKFSEERIFSLFDAAGFSNPLGDLPPNARGTHPSKKWGDSALDYVFLRGLKSVRLPHIEPNDGLSDHYALFTLVSPFSACLHSGVSF